MNNRYDLIIVGGGLAGGLAATRIKQKRPSCLILLIEQGKTLGGNHTWSFHDEDISAEQHRWVRPFISRSWTGTEVRFPNHQRFLPTPYHSIASEHFHETLVSSKVCEFLLETTAKELAPTRVGLEGGKELSAGVVIDARGWENTGAVPAAYQKFVGLDLTLKSPHGLTHPLLMDAIVDQKGGYRFFYLLPWSERSLLIEDTRYSDSPDMGSIAIETEIFSYVESRGWSVESVDRREKGVLDIPLEGSLPSWDEAIPRLGSRAGLFHATTGYSLPMAVRAVDALADLETFSSEAVFQWSRDWAELHWKNESFSRLLNRLLFRAANPEERYRILEKFYRHPEGLINRFYAGQLTMWDRFRLLSGKPPVSILRSLSCILEKKGRYQNDSAR